MSAGRAHTAVVSDSGAVFTLGNNAYGQCGRAIIDGERYTGSRVVHCIPHLDGEPAKVVECGQDHTLVTLLSLLNFHHSSWLEWVFNQLYSHYFILENLGEMQGSFL